MAKLIQSKRETEKLRCLIVDDEPVAIQGLALYISKLDFLEVVRTCPSAIEAEEILKMDQIDLMFLDINMPHLTGIEFLETLKNVPLTILTTAYSEYALDGYRLNVVDYLLKPIGFQRFFQAVSKARDIFISRLLLQQPEHSPSSCLFVRQGDHFTQISWENILYIEGMQNYAKLHFKDKILTIHQTMISLEEILPKNFFFRIHRSYLVNISHIDSVSGNRLFLNGKELPIAGAKREELYNHVIFKNLISK